MGKAIPYNLVAGDKGKDSANIGIAFMSDEGKVPMSITLSLDRLKKQLDSKNLTSRKEEASKTKYPNPYENEQTVRIVGFVKNKKSEGGLL